MLTTAGWEGFSPSADLLSPGWRAWSLLAVALLLVGSRPNVSPAESRSCSGFGCEIVSFLGGELSVIVRLELAKRTTPAGTWATYWTALLACPTFGSKAWGTLRRCEAVVCTAAWVE